jgi:hypothetical protein
MDSVNTSLCVIQGVWGNFQSGLNDSVAIYIDANGYWTLNGTRTYPWDFLTVKAMCVPWSNFYHDTPTHKLAPGQGWSSFGGQTNLWGFDSFCFMTGMAGTMNAVTYQVQVYPNSFLNDDVWRLFVYDGQRWGAAQCMTFSPQPFQVIPTLYPDPQHSTGYVVDSATHSTSLPSSQTALCALNSTTGWFTTPASGAWIDVNGNSLRQLHRLLRSVGI